MEINNYGLTYGRGYVYRLQYHIVWQMANGIEPDENPSFILDEIALYVQMFKDDFK